MRSILLALALLLTLAITSTAEARCRSGRCGREPRPGFFGFHRSQVLKRAERPVFGVLARARFSPGR